MKPCPAFPSLELYPLHDNDGYLEFVTGMWLHTRAIAGAPCALEVFLTLCGQFPEKRIDQVIAWMRAHGQLMTEADLIEALRPETILVRTFNRDPVNLAALKDELVRNVTAPSVNWAERLVA